MEVTGHLHALATLSLVPGAIGDWVDPRAGSDVVFLPEIESRSDSPQPVTILSEGN